MFQGPGTLMEVVTDSSMDAEVLTSLPSRAAAGCVVMFSKVALTMQLQAGRHSSNS